MLVACDSRVVHSLFLLWRHVVALDIAAAPQPPLECGENEPDGPEPERGRVTEPVLRLVLCAVDLARDTGSDVSILSPSPK